MKKLPFIFLILLVIAGIATLIDKLSHDAPPTEAGNNNNPVKERKLLGSAVYSCDKGKTISATYYENKEPQEVGSGEMPIPTGSVDVSFDGGNIMTFSQTLSASGIRYANADESFVFWSKGNEALVMHDNEMDLEYTNCKES